jgi:hypothetical protein
VYFGVERFYPPVEAFGKLGEILGLHNFDARLSQPFRGSSGGNDLYTAFGEPLCEFDYARFIGYADYRSLNHAKSHASDHANGDVVLHGRRLLYMVVYALLRYAFQYAELYGKPSIAPRRAAERAVSAAPRRF